MSEKPTRSELWTAGIVTDHTSRRTYGMDNHPGMLFFPSVRFQTADGRTVELQNKLGTNVPLRVGDEVTAIYDPTRPEEAKVALRSMFRFSPKAFAVAGAIFLGAMAFFFLFFVAVIVFFSLS